MIGNPIIKNSVVYGITCLFVISCLSSGASRFDEIVDQHQDIFDPYSGYAISIKQTLAQSFKPSMTPLIKVDLAIGKGSETTMPLIISIRENLEGNDLTSITIPAEQILFPYLQWYSFDFPDIIVIPENTYYIVVRCNGTPLQGYALGFNDEAYPRGTAWGYWQHSPGNWSWLPLVGDYAFRTYSSIQPPNPPTVTGPHYGKINTAYTFSIGPITNPEGGPFYVIFGWGDENISGWLGPYDAGQTASISHAWSKSGNYTIKVKIKDSYGAESDWSAPFYIEIVRLKTKLFLGVFESVNQTEDLIILHTRLFIVFPSNPMFNIGGIVVLSKEYYGYLGRIVAVGVGGGAVL